jgi:hypothetical protein
MLEACSSHDWRPNAPIVELSAFEQRANRSDLQCLGFLRSRLEDRQD